MRRALARLGAGRARCCFIGWPDGDVQRSGRAPNLRRTLRLLKPGIVLAASPMDHHADHKAGWALASAALRGTHIPLFAYAVWSRSDGSGKSAHDLGVGVKRWAIAAHRSQTTDYVADDPQGFTLSPKVLATLVSESEFFAVFRGSTHRREL